LKNIINCIKQSNEQFKSIANWTKYSTLILGFGGYGQSSGGGGSGGYQQGGSGNSGYGKK